MPAATQRSRVLHHGVGRHRDDGQVGARSLFQGADPGRGLESVHLGHLAIHEDGVEAFPGHQLQRLEAVAGDGHPGAGVFQDLAGHDPVDLLVLHQEDPRVQRDAVRDRRAGIGDRVPRDQLGLRALAGALDGQG